jgi:hypothetical protein
VPSPVLRAALERFCTFLRSLMRGTFVARFMSTDDEPIISIEAELLRHVSVDDALEAFRQFVGAATSWNSALMKRRIENDGDIDWRIEVGQWILRARQHGLEDFIQGRLNGSRALTVTSIDPNDQAHSNFLAEMAPAMLVHYLSAFSWSLLNWEGPQQPNEDIDVEMKSPTGASVAFQVKSTDKPGRWLGYKVLPSGELDDKLSFEDGSTSAMIGRIVVGESDDWVRAAMTKAAKQLPNPARQPSMIALCSQRRWPLGSTPDVIERVALGQTFSDPERMPEPFLDLAMLAAEQAASASRGEEPRLFPGLFNGPWKHLGGILTLDYRRGWDRFDYMCTVILNPWCETAARCDPSWFPRARVLVLDGDRFKWIPKGFQPGDSRFRNGTRLV